MVALAACILNLFSWTKRAIYSNFIGSIEVTCRSKVAKILLTGSPKWPPSWKSILNFFSWTDRPNDLDLFGNEVSDTRPSWSSFTIYGQSGHLVQRSSNIWTNYQYPFEEDVYMLHECIHVYSPGAREITPGNKSLILIKKFYYFNHIL